MATVLAKYHAGQRRPGLIESCPILGSSTAGRREYMHQALYLRALDLFNRACFFDAHEVWEDVWRAAPPEEKKFLQGLIQIAVAFHHRSTGNLVGARSLLERGTRNLQGYPEEHGDLRLAVFLHSLAAWKRALADGGPLPPLPHIDRCEG